MADCHIHTNFSFDSDTPIREYCRRAVQLGLDEICITDHYDPDDRPGMEVLLDLDAYIEEIKKADAHFTNLKVSKGIEIGVTCGMADMIQEEMEPRQYDYIINSQHIADGVDIYFDRSIFDAGRSRAYERCLKAQLKLLKCYELWSCIGHIGYFSKYYGREGAMLKHADAPEIIDEILKTVIKKGKGIEVNTSGYMETGGMLPPLEIVKRYRELGGEVVTVGSDCHVLGRLFDRIPQALDVISEAGFKYYTTFKEMTPVFHPIYG